MRSAHSRGWPAFIRRVGSVQAALLTVWLTGYGYVALRPLSDPDTPWHIATGLYILRHHQVPVTDPFSWTMRGQPWVTQEWLFDVVLAWLVRRWAFAGVWLFLVVVHALTVLVLYRLALRASGGQRVMAAVLACLGTLVAYPFWIARPQVISYLMFALFLWLLERVREDSFRTLWLAPPLLFVWANAHGSASIGILMLLFDAAVSLVPPFGRLRSLELPNGARLRLVLAAAAGFGLGLLNPNHLRAFTYAWLATNPVMTNNIIEWQSPDFHSVYFQYEVLPFLAAALCVVIVSRRDLPLRDVLYFGGTLVLTLIHQRFLPYAAIAAVPLLADVTAAWGRSLPDLPALSRGVCGVLSVAAAGACVWYIPHVRGPLRQHMDASACPVAAVDYLIAHHLTDHLLNSYRYGGYLIYRGVPTFVDGRTDIFLRDNPVTHTPVFNDYLALKNVWWNCPQLLQQYGFRAALFPNGYPILTYLTQNPDWVVAYQDGTAEVVVRRR
ncbi:MAG: hypothetical protein IRZ33_06545 [Alicyclobacillaceae bacterium]|nr:hypothetical protein [Alicyclobacillaceae bacterium]